MSRQLPILATALAALLFPAAAYAHTASGAHAHGLELGLMHPLTGLDHLLAMVAIGVWAVRSSPRDVWIAPAAFVAGMSVGLFARLPVVPAAGIELLIALSLAMLGMALAFTVKLPGWAMMLLAAGAGLAHGAAHAAEGPIQSGFAGFAVGALMATIVLHAMGVVTGLAAARLHRSIPRIAGVALAIFGLGAALASV